MVTVQLVWLCSQQCAVQVQSRAARLSISAHLGRKQNLFFLFQSKSYCSKTKIPSPVICCMEKAMPYLTEAEGGAARTRAASSSGRCLHEVITWVLAEAALLI